MASGSLDASLTGEGKKRSGPEDHGDADLSSQDSVKIDNATVIMLINFLFMILLPNLEKLPTKKF
jgi:hypothetical protein